MLSPDQCVHLDVELVERIHDEALALFGGAAGLRDRALLESAVAAPQATAGGVSVFADPLRSRLRICFICAAITRLLMATNAPHLAPV
jgi:hypothetical protein